MQADLFAFIRELRALGVTEYQGVNPYDTAMMVTVKLGALPSGPAPADVAEAKEASEDVDPIDALNARIFGDPIPAKVNGGV